MMPTIPKGRRYWLAYHRVDFRKSFEGMLAEAYYLDLDPFAGDVVLFAMITVSGYWESVLFLVR